MTLASSLKQAQQALNDDDPQRALAILMPLSESHPALAQVWQLLALAHKHLDDTDAAESAFRRALALDDNPHVATQYGGLLRSLGRFEEALQQFDSALTVEPGYLPAALGRGACLLQLEQFPAAEALFSSLLDAGHNDPEALLGLGESLQRQGFQEPAIGVFSQLLESHPAHAGALKGIGLSLKALGFVAEAADFLERALAEESDDAACWQEYAGVLALAGRDEEAIAAYREALEREPTNIELHNLYNAFLGVIDHPDYLASYGRQLARSPFDPAMAAALARRFTLNHRDAEARQVLESGLQSAADHPQLLCELSHLEREHGDFDAAARHAGRAFEQAPGMPALAQAFATALIAAGDYHRAESLLTEQLMERPLDQGLLALYTTVLRYLGRSDYHRLVDYEALVHCRWLQAPEQGDSLDAFMGRISAEIGGLHSLRRHPVEQSPVNGTQTLDNLFNSRQPGVRQLMAAIDQALSTLLEELPRDSSHPVLSRNLGAFEFSDSWSVALGAGGFHRNHFHPEGWLSSACYLEIPDGEHRAPGEGWLKFGEPGFRCREPLPAEYWIRPQPGMIVVFPSYLWHGTEPQRGDKRRLTVGYDILPADHGE